MLARTAWLSLSSARLLLPSLASHPFNRGNRNGLSRAFGIRDQDGRRRRIQDLHVDARYGHPRLHGRRHPDAGGVVRRHNERQHRPADHRGDPVSRRLLHALSVRLRPADRRVRAVSAGADRQASGRNARRRAAQLGSGVHRQFRWRIHRRGDGGDRLHVRIFIAARQGRHRARPYRREPHRGLRGPRHQRHADAVCSRHALQLDGIGRCGRCDDLDLGQRQGDRDVDADHAVLRHDLRALDREHVPVSRRPAARRPLHRGRLPVLERDPDRGRQPCRRPRLHRAHAVRHARQDGAEAHAGLIAIDLRGPRPSSRGPLRQVSMMPRELKISVGQHSDKGRKEANKDFHGVRIPDEPLLSLKGIAVVLADGISSSNVSRIAAESAVKGFLTDYYCTSESWSVRTSAQRVLEATNSWLHSQTRRSQYSYDRDRGYVCTLSALVIKSTTAHLFHIGDSRIYRVSGNTLEQLTEDHRVVISSEQSYLGRALGVNSQIEIDYLMFGVEKGDTFVLVTDGIYEHAGDRQIARVINESEDDLNKAARAIVELAYELGS